jgi:DNA-binding cell septation regulator SpoVG
MTIVTPPPAVERDRYNRPLVTPPNGGKKVAYTRCTTYIDCIEDKYNLQKWMQRMVAIGLASRPDLLLGVNAHRDDKNALDRYCEDAREAAAASAAATTGTALHALTELIDRGQELPAGLAPNILASLEAYRQATAELTATHIEQFCVQDHLKIGGTPDRVVKYQGASYIADLKTGSIQWGILKIAMQLAVYARSHTYDVATGIRGEHSASIERGLVIHLPVVENPADAVCTLHWVDLLEGWNSVIIARNVREKRKLKFTDIASPFGVDVETSLVDSIKAEIDKCTTPDAVRGLWTPEWTDELTDYAREYVNGLPAAS